MKKIFSFIVGLVAFTTLQAASYTEAARITMTCEGGPESQELVLIVDPAQASPATVANLASTYEVGQVNLYASYENGQFSSFKASAISNLPVVVVTNRRDDDYTLTFNVPISTEGLTLTDLRSATGLKTINIAAGESYSFNVADEANYAANTNVVIADRFIINYEPAPAYVAEVTTNAYGLATFSFDQPLAPVEAGVKLYKGAISGNDLNLTQVADYAAEQGVVVYGEANTTYHFEVINGATADFSGNELKAASTWAYPHAGTTAYVLSGSSLYIYEGENMKPNKAFLLLEANSGNAPRRISFRFNGTTAFENVEMNEAKAVKFMEDGKVFIKRGDAIYNLQGQLVK